MLEQAKASEESGSQVAKESIRLSIFSVASCVCPAREEISDATTAKPLPASPALAASMTAESIQTQLIKTEEIQKHIENVEKAAASIVENVNSTRNAIGSGNTNIGSMLEQANLILLSCKQL